MGATGRLIAKEYSAQKATVKGGLLSFLLTTHPIVITIERNHRGFLGSSKH
jgi:hypothetical protein